MWFQLSRVVNRVTIYGTLSVLNLFHFFSYDKTILCRRQKLDRHVFWTSLHQPANFTKGNADFSSLLQAQSISAARGSKNTHAIAQLQANEQLEDRAFIFPIETEEYGSFLLAAVVDGHGGSEIAELVYQYLPKTVEHYVLKALANKPQSDVLPKILGEALSESFQKLDSVLEDKVRILHDFKVKRIEKIGACCAAVLVTPDWFVTANVGDCGILLVQKEKSIMLTRPHNVNDPIERLKFIRDHSQDSDAVICKLLVSMALNASEPAREFDVMDVVPNVLSSVCYVKGRLQVTRAFGDFYLKDKHYLLNHETGRPHFKFGNSYPFVTCIPEINIKRRDSVNDDHLVLASDGLWEVFSSEEVAEIANSAIVSGAKNAATSLVKSVLDQASRRLQKNAFQIMNLSHSQRRRIYDDTTACIVDLEPKWRSSKSESSHSTEKLPHLD